MELARDAVNNLERLGPTFIKLGQIMSIRPDVLPPPVMRALAKLQDNIQPFSNVEARAMVEAELGKPIVEMFSEFSDEPIAAASLAQVRPSPGPFRVLGLLSIMPGREGSGHQDVGIMTSLVGGRALSDSTHATCCHRSTVRGCSPPERKSQ